MVIEQKPRIIILGDQKLVGATSTMIKILKNKWNDNYAITGVTKPDAKSQDILLDCNNLSHLNNNDRVILSIGSNDTNPYEVGRQLGLALEKLQNTQVFVVPVLLL